MINPVDKDPLQLALHRPPAGIVLRISYDE